MFKLTKFICDNCRNYTYDYSIHFYVDISGFNILLMRLHPPYNIFIDYALYEHNSSVHFKIKKQFIVTMREIKIHV